MGKTLLKISVVYFMLGISFGLYMSLTHVFTLTSVHVHINLLGWMSLALIGVFYHLYPSLEKTGLAKWHFWLHNIGLPVMMIAIALAILGVSRCIFPNRNSRRGSDIDWYLLFWFQCSYESG